MDDEYKNFFVEFGGGGFDGSVLFVGIGGSGGEVGFIC